MTAATLTATGISMKSLLRSRKKSGTCILHVAESDERLCIVNCSDDKGQMMPQEKIFDIIIKILGK